MNDRNTDTQNQIFKAMHPNNFTQISITSVYLAVMADRQADTATRSNQQNPK